MIALLRKTVTTTLLALATAAAFADFTQEDLQKMVNELDAHMPRYAGYTYPIDCSIEENKKINAYATVTIPEGADITKVKPQAKMVVFTGLVEFLDGDENLIRAVVAHELAHLSKGHPTAGGFKVDDVQALFIRQIELEADAVGGACLAAAGHDKDHMIQVLRKLDELGKSTPLMHQIGADHPTGAARAAAVADNPLVYQSLADFVIGNGFMQNRRYSQAANAYDRAIAKEPNFNEAYINKAQADLMDYYDKLPQRLKQTWFRPDFGPVILETPIGSRLITADEADLRRYQKAITSINAAIAKAPSNSRANELKALAQVLDPEGNPANLNAGKDGFQSLLKSSSNETDSLRYANNLAIGQQRTNDLSAAATTMMNAQKASKKLNRYLALNMGLTAINHVKQEDLGLALGMMYSWLRNSSGSHPDYKTIAKNYITTCEEKGFKAQEATPIPTYLCQATTLVVNGKEVSIFEPIQASVTNFGKANIAYKFSDLFPDMMELRWNEFQMNLLGDGKEVYRATTYLPGSYLTLKPQDDTIDYEFKITVGMTVDDFKKILNLDAAEQVSLVRSGTIETWHYFPALLMGVAIKDDKVTGITVSPQGFTKDE